MAQADGVVSNASGAAVRADINDQLAAVFTNHSGATQPATISGHQWWYDEANNILKIRNDADSGWINVIDFNTGAEGALHVPVGAAATTSIRPAADANSGFFFRQGTNAANDGYGFGYAMAGTEYLTVQANTTDQSTPDLCWLSTDVSLNVNTANTAGVQFTQSGRVVIQKDSGFVLGLNRTTDDGDLMLFNAQGNNEGSISVSGTTVSYNGGHLSRWSQLPGGNSRAEILRGSIMSNTDEMCEWGAEDNEQLNRCKVSEVEGDVDVAGVFQDWDNDDQVYTNDFRLAMTGDFVIRLAQGTTVARGDLLMSAGDGTAKPQGDDIVRSKTIAKVTSTAVSTTYADGSYCVPCVLMAC
nr:hypothetical protein [uncultured Mediterranean phage uvMED]